MRDEKVAMQNKCTGFESNFGMSRRNFLNQFGLGVGGAALAQMVGADPLLGQEPDDQAKLAAGILQKLHHAPKAKRVIFLFQAGGPSQIDLFDYKPVLNEQHGQQLFLFRSSLFSDDRLVVLD